jgi:hypothetical protein
LAITREQIMEALFTVLQGSSEFVTASRRLQNPEGLTPASTPALFLVEHEDNWERGKGGYNLPPIRSIHARAIVYIDVGNDPNAIPSSFINMALDAIETAFAPDNHATNSFTLGGLVQACVLDGNSVRASGDVTGKGLADVPIRILLP